MDPRYNTDLTSDLQATMSERDSVAWEDNNGEPLEELKNSPISTDYKISQINLKELGQLLTSE